MIGDSFAWTMFEFPIAPGIFSRVDFRFYNRERHRFGEPTEVPNDPVAAALVHDVVLLLVGEGNADRAGWGWVGAAHAAHAALVAPEGEAAAAR